MGLMKDKIPSQLWDRIEKGEEKTISEWAKIFHVTKAHVYNVINKMRKKGYMIYPIGTIMDPYNGSSEGVLRNVLDSKKYVSEIIHRSSQREIPPRIKSVVKLMEEVIIEFPDQWAEIETYISEIMLMAVRHKEELKQLNAHPETYENTGDSVKQNQGGSKSA